jgi:hypothetical protein
MRAEEGVEMFWNFPIVKNKQAVHLTYSMEQSPFWEANQ